MKITSACMVLTGCLAGLVGVAHAAPAPGTFYLRGTTGYATQALGDINRDVEIRASNLRYVLSPIDWNKMGGAVRLEEAGGYQISPHLSVGVGMGYQKSRATQSGTYGYSDNTGAIWAGTLTDRTDISALDVFGSLTVWTPAVPGLHFIAQAGVARAKYRVSAIARLATSDVSYETLVSNEEADKTAPTVGLYAGYEVPLFSRVGVSGQVGYRYCSFKRPNATTTRSEENSSGGSVETGSSPLLDANGDPMDIDLSGLRINLGLTLRLAARR